MFYRASQASGEKAKDVDMDVQDRRKMQKPLDHCEERVGTVVYAARGLAFKRQSIVCAQTTRCST